MFASTKATNYVEQFKSSQGYQEIEAIVWNELGKIVSNNKKLLQNALFSVMLALRNDPDRYFIVDRIELTPFTNTILNYNSFLGKFSERVLDVAEKILYNL
jgi:hypothetical protein